MAISLDEVEHVAKLARLELDENELFTFQSELNALLGTFQDIDLANVAGIDPRPHAVELQNAWAQDVASYCLTRGAALRNAPLTKGGLFVVPTIIED